MIHGLFLKRTNLSNRQDAKVAKANKIDVFDCGETMSGKLGVLGVLAVKNKVQVEFQAKTMAENHDLFFRFHNFSIMSLRQRWGLALRFSRIAGKHG